GDACDTDDDNDGFTDADELSGVMCAGAVTDPLRPDTDGDRVLDRPECLTMHNPNSPLSAPALAQCGTGDDMDGDGVIVAREFCFYATSDTNADSDADGCRDGREVATVNADSTVNAIDLG